ncbi:MAG: ribonuclease [Tissierellia bacterium]|nr:ribonuclease [Tissierellia bacterium]
MDEGKGQEGIDLEDIFDDEEDSQEPSNPEESTIEDEKEDNEEEVSDGIEREGRYTSKDDVAAYLRKYGELPKNYITKKDAGDMGWVASKGNLWDVTDNMSIGGDRFGNREGLLPSKKGRIYYEADIDYEGGRRNAKRIVFSNDGLIFYTDDHYASFEDITEEE